MEIVDGRNLIPIGPLEPRTIWERVIVEVEGGESYETYLQTTIYVAPLYVG